MPWTPRPLPELRPATASKRTSGSAKSSPPCWRWPASAARIRSRPRRSPTGSASRRARSSGTSPTRRRSGSRSLPGCANRSARYSTRRWRRRNRRWRKIERAFLAHVAFVAANPGVPRVLFHELQYPGDSPVRAEVRRDDRGLQQAPGAALHRRPRRRASFPPISMPPSRRCCSSAPCRAWSSSPRSPATRPRMIKRARQLFPLLLHGYRGRRKP